MVKTNSDFSHFVIYRNLIHLEQFCLRIVSHEQITRAQFMDESVPIPSVTQRTGHQHEVLFNSFTSPTWLLDAGLVSPDETRGVKTNRGHAFAVPPHEVRSKWEQEPLAASRPSSRAGSTPSTSSSCPFISAFGPFPWPSSTRFVFCRIPLLHFPHLLYLRL